MRPSARWLCLGYFLTCGCVRAAGPEPAPTILPLTTLRLYETGVGYFERSGTLTATEHTALPVPASHLDDALASLVVLAPGVTSPVRGLSFDSRVSSGMARALAGLPTEADGPVGYRELLASLKGARVEVRAGSSAVVGRLIEIEGPDEPTLRLVILTDRSELVRVAASSVTSIRPTDPAYANRLNAALDAIGTQAARSRRMLDVLGASRGAVSGPVTIGYVAETPVWRTTYRVVLGGPGAAAARSVLQGWALVHNDTDEDWQDVNVALVNGRPDSFLFPLAAPRYARRELVHPDDQLSTVPQLLTNTADGLWGDNVDDASGAGGIGLSGLGGGGGSGEGVGYGRIGTIGHGAGAASSSVLAVGDLATVAQGAGAEAGALFVYPLPDRLALRSHASALVPFVDASIDAQPIAWLDAPGEPARAAVRLVNSTSQTLPAGSIAFFAEGGFAGESGLDRLKPGDRRFVRFGADLDVDVRASRATTPRVRETTQRLTYARGRLVEHFLRTTDAAYAFENRSSARRAVYLALHIDRNARVTGADEVDFDAATSTPLAVVGVAPKTTLERAIVTVEGLAREVAIADLQGDALAKLATALDLALNDRTVAAEALTRQRALDETRRARARATADLDAIEKQLERLREDAKAVGSDRGAVAPPEFVRRLLASEERHTALRADIERLAGEEKSRAEAVESSLKKLAD